MGWEDGGYVTDVFVLPDSTIVCQLHKLTLSDQAQVTLQLTDGPSDLVFRLLARPPFWRAGRGPGRERKNFPPRPEPAAGGSVGKYGV